ncbi:MAG: ankyrin repeat domain-containing protein [Chlamydiae bacterium]|nr:ankyrin repeat domain-containing protein [Chlamydiota bacterium]
MTTSLITNNDNFSWIPNEVIAHIFSYLNVKDCRISEVSRLWNALAIRYLNPNTPTTKDQIWLTKVITSGHTNLAIDLIKFNQWINPGANNNAAIQLASQNGHFKVVKELLEDSRVDPSANNNEAIRNASEKGHLEVVKELLNDPRVDPSTNNNEAIRKASENNHPKVVKELLQDSRVNPSVNYNEAIRVASSIGYSEVVKELLKDRRVHHKE